MNLNVRFSALTNLHSQGLSSPRRHSTEGTTISALTKSRRQVYAADSQLSAALKTCHSLSLHCRPKAVPEEMFFGIKITV